MRFTSRDPYQILTTTETLSSPKTAKLSSLVSHNSFSSLRPDMSNHLPDSSAVRFRLEPRTVLIICWLLALALGGLRAWATRYQIDPDRSRHDLVSGHGGCLLARRLAHGPQ